MRSHCNEKAHALHQSIAQLTTTRESPRAATKIQHSQEIKINRYILKKRFLYKKVCNPLKIKHEAWDEIIFVNYKATLMVDLKFLWNWNVFLSQNLVRELRNKCRRTKIKKHSKLRKCVLCNWFRNSMYFEIPSDFFLSWKWIFCLESSFCLETSKLHQVIFVFPVFSQSQCTL